MTEKKLSEGFFCRSKIYDDRYENLTISAAQSGFEGHSMEFGVWKGASISHLASYYPSRKFWGFDSFSGLPEPWVRSFDCSRMNKKGDFGLDAIPELPSSIHLVIGPFDETLPVWLAQNEGSVAFVHIDSDLYSSSQTILKTLNKRIVPGTVIVFDELRDWNNQGVYERWKEGEWKALIEWIDGCDRVVEPLSRTNWVEGTIRVLV